MLSDQAYANNLDTVLLTSKCTFWRSVISDELEFTIEAITYPDES